MWTHRGNIANGCQDDLQRSRFRISSATVDCNDEEKVIRRACSTTAISILFYSVFIVKLISNLVFTCFVKRQDL